jgi:hypothetical protein
MRSYIVRPGGESTCMNCRASEGLILVYVYGIGSVAGTEWSGIHWASFYREIQLCNLFGNNDHCMRMVISYLLVNNDVCIRKV